MTAAEVHSRHVPETALMSSLLQKQHDEYVCSKSQEKLSVAVYGDKEIMETNKEKSLCRVDTAGNGQFDIEFPIPDCFLTESIKFM